jgi:hypothetical protein
MNKSNVLVRLSALVAAFGSVLLTAHPRPAAAAEGFEDKTAGYNQCVMWAAQVTRSVTAVQIIQNACQKVWYEGSMIRDSDKQVYVCLLRALRGVDNDYAAQLIYASCVNQR